MSFGPDYSSSDEEGLSDDNEYYEFKEKLKANRKQNHEVEKSEAEQKQELLKSVFAAILAGNDEAFQAFDNGLDINDDLEPGWTPLLLAATTANPDTVVGLLERGANVNGARGGKETNTADHLSFTSNVTDEGATPLMRLCNISAKDEVTEKKILSCVQILLEKGADPSAIDNRRRTAIMVAAFGGHMDTIKCLLPLVDKDAVDNQGWDMLFWAVAGNNYEIVKFLLDDGFTAAKRDIRGQTVIELANSNNFTRILELLPSKDSFDEFCVYLNNNQYNFEEIFIGLKENEKPQLFTDICNILYGTRSESVVPIFSEKQMDLCQFLSLTDNKLRDLGIKFPFQRNRIMGGIYRFHKHPFKPQSVPFVKRNELYTNIDVGAAVLTCIKQVIIMEASLKFILENSDQKLTLRESKEAKILMSTCRHLIKRLKAVSQRLVYKTKKWDLQVTPADKITKKRLNIPWCNLCLSMGVISLIALYKFKGF